MRIPTDLELDHSCTVAHVRTGVHAHVLIHEPAPLAAKLSDRTKEEKRKRKKNRTGVHAVVLIHEPVALEEPAVVNRTVAARFYIIFLFKTKGSLGYKTPFTAIFGQNRFRTYIHGYE